ncbi:MAG: glycoside hydrolase family 20 zincin-like fold domain-containing protein, partial [Candidatus Hydrogenedentota bacterium]
MAAVLSVLMLASAQIPLTPVPQEVTFEGKSTFRLSPTDPIIVPTTRIAERDTAVALIRRASGFDLPVVTTDSHRRGARGIYLVEGDSHEPAKRRLPGSIMNFIGGKPEEPSIPRQGYSLRVTKERIEVAGGDPAGTFYGVQTLCQLIGEHGEVPCVTIEDSPDLPWRGAWVDSPLSPEQLDAFAALKCNLVVFESDDFLDLTPERLRKWRKVFEEARHRHIEPVPAIRTLKNVAPLLKRHPEAAVARLITEKIQLEDDNWALLSHPNILESPTSPIIVSGSTKTYREGDDYAIDRGDFAYPYENTNTPWLIRRNIGAAIPDGGEVTITYAYVPPGTTDCFPVEKATEQAWLGILETITRELKPRFIAAKHDWPRGAFNDPRLETIDSPQEAAKAQSIHALDKLARRTAPDVRLLVISDMFRGPRPKTPDLTASLPPSAAYILEAPDAASPDDVRAFLEPWLSRNLEVFGMPSPSLSSTYAWGGAVSDRNKRLQGILTPVETGKTSTAAFRIAMQKS